MVSLCAALKDIDNTTGRGDCFALIDFSSNHTSSDLYTDLNDLYGNPGTFIDDQLEYWKFAFCTYPWVIKKVKLELVTGDTNKIVPLELTGSYA